MYIVYGIIVVGAFAAIWYTVRLDRILTTLSGYHEKFNRTNSEMHVKAKAELFMESIPRVTSLFTKIILATAFSVLLGAAISIVSYLQS